jgi:flotillin
MDQAQIIGIAIGLGALALMLLLAFVKSNMVICQPNEIVILAGRKRRMPDGSVVGYRVIRGGRGFKWPILESVARLSLTTTPIEVHLPNTLCEGMIPVAIEGRANVKLAGRPEDGLENAIERFLGKGNDAVVKTAQQTLEGALRGVIATVKPEEANAKRLALADQVAERARADFGQLGIVLDFFQIQSISDSHGYLEAIGRMRNAEVIRDARVAEASSEAESRQVAAEQGRLGREAEIKAELAIVQEENGLAVKRAQLQAEANRAEQKAAVAADIARVEEQIELETKRAERATKREEANTIIPAQSHLEAQKLEAEGHAAKILENGKATAQAVELMRQQWQDGQTHDLFMIQMLPGLLDKVTRVIAENLNVDKLTIIDGGEGTGLPAYVKNVTNSAVVMLEQLRNATGIDLEKLAKNTSSKTGGELPKELG